MSATNRDMTSLKTYNWIGLWTLYMREVRRFMKVYTQTLAAPAVTALLFLVVFALALGGADRQILGISFVTFLAPGLVMMAIAQNAFANTSSSMVVSKVQGNIVDILLPPLSAHELTTGIALGGMTRGVVVGSVVGIVMAFFVDLQINHLFYVVFHGFAASLMLSLIGIMAGIWSEKFDHIAAVTNFIVTPLSFLSGTFYTINQLPETAQMLARLNPFFYMIDGFRYGFIGHADADPLFGVAVLCVINICLWMGCHRMFASGYKLKD